MIAFCAALFFVTASFAGIMHCAVRASKQPPVPTNDSLLKLLGSKREGGGGRL